MPSTAQLSSTTKDVAGRFAGAIIARGRGYYYNGSLNQSNFLNIKIGFVYSDQPIDVGILSADQEILFTTIGQNISTIEKADIYPGGSTLMDVDYSMKIEGLSPNTTYYVRAYSKSGSTGYYKYGEQLSVSTLSGVSGQHGYYISDDTVGFYDPLQIRNSNEDIERVLTSDSSGFATWKPVKSLFTFGHYIGERYGGGIVAAVWREGDDEKVLIVAESDISVDTPTGLSIVPAWSYGVSGTTLIGTSAQSKYNGYLNTAAIVAQANALGTTFSAAAGAAAYRGGGYEDWYLPSYYEFNQVFNNLAIINKVIGIETINSIAAYWTSTEYSSNRAFTWTGQGTGQYSIENKLAEKNCRVRPVRKESVYTGDGLILNLDATNKKSFSDTDYFNLGTASRWKDLVNGGMTSSYWFGLSAYPTTSSGGTIYNPFPLFTTAGTTADVFSGYIGGWNLVNISAAVPTTPKLYNRGGVSSMTSDYFTAYGDAMLTFESGNYSDTVGGTVKLAIYVSEKIGTYATSYYFLKEVLISGSIAPYSVPIYQYGGKNISIRITSPDSYWNSTSSFSGPSIDTILIKGTSGGYQALGPVYFPSEGGFLRFNGSGASGAYVDITAPIGNATTVTVEMWARIRKVPSTIMLFGWNRYDVIMGSLGEFGFNTGQGDIYGVTSSLYRNFTDTWKHFVFEMRSDVSYTNNKIYVNGNQQILSPQVAPYGGNLGVENPTYRNFNGGVGRIGAWNNQFNSFGNFDVSVFRVYNRALTKDEIMKNYSNEKKRYEIVPSILTNNLLTHIDFNSSTEDGSTTTSIQDISGNNRPASLNVYSTTLAPSIFKSSSLYIGKSMRFPGSRIGNPYLFWPNSTPFQNMTSFSVSLWMKIDNRTVGNGLTPTEASYVADIITKWSDTDNSVGPWRLFYRYDYDTSTGAVYNSYIGINLWDGSGSSTYLLKAGSKQIPFGNWINFCATYDASTKKIKTYIDASLDIDSAAPNSFAITTQKTGDIYVAGRPSISYSTGSGTWVCPPGITSVTVECWGAGGGGAGANTSGGGGGGGGAYVRNTISVTPGTTYYWSVGAGGAPGAGGPSGTNGGNGGSTWFNSINIAPTSAITGALAGGGFGGSISRAGGAGSITGIGAIAYSGGNGANGVNTSGNGGGGGGAGAGSLGPGTSGGFGGSSINGGFGGPGGYGPSGIAGGAGGAGGLYTVAGSNAGGNGAFPGGGGGGVYYFSSTNPSGGAGAPGRISISADVNSFVGSIANIQIYDKALSSGEVKNNFDAGKFIFEPTFNDSERFYSHEINGNPTFSISQKMSLEIGSVNNEKILKLDAMGYSKWVDKSSLFTRPSNYRYIGELYGGGIIVAMWYYPKTIFNYLIMSTEDVSTGTQWSNVTNLFAGATSEFKGETNTNTIVAQGGHTTSAAKICKDYRGGGYSDWYLPSVFEMNQAFNASSIVDTVLGSDKLDGVYWTSTEPYNDAGTTGAISYSFTETGMFIGTNTGVQKNALKTNTLKARAFRLATNAVNVNVWNPTWDDTYTPWWTRWRGYDYTTDIVTFWEMDWAPARYTPTDFNYWRSTSVTTGTLDLFSTSGTGPYTLTFKVRGSTVTTFDEVLEFGVCWKGTLSNTGNFGSVTPPTISDNRVVGTGAYSSYTSTIVWPGVPDISYYSAFGYKFEIDVCAYVKTTSGVYYGTRYYYPYNVGIA